MNPQPPDDDPRDAHLLAALRHAPDRDVVPPAQLTAAILGQARRAVRRRGARAWRDGIRAALERLWHPAPMAAFGTLALATLIGVMWRDQEWPDATPSLRPERAVVCGRARRRVAGLESNRGNAGAAAGAGGAEASAQARAGGEGTGRARTTVTPGCPAGRAARARDHGGAVVAAAVAGCRRGARAGRGDGPGELALQREARAKSQADAAPRAVGARRAKSPARQRARPCRQAARR